MKSDRVLVFLKDDKYESIKDQIDTELDEMTGAFNIVDLVIMSKTNWTIFEGELMPFVNARYEKLKVIPYYQIDGESLIPHPPNETVESSGWISLTYRGKPFVAMNNDDSNIISARLGAN
jgi:hypothetical protein